MARRTRAYVLMGSTAVLWLLGVSPIGNIGKGCCLMLSVGCAIESIQESGRLIKSDAEDAAVRAMAEELEVLELSLATDRQERDLKRSYLPELFSPEIRQELEQQLEANYKASNVAKTFDFQTSDDSQKPLYLAIRGLMEGGKSFTYVIEEVLKLGGSRWTDGKAALDALLKLGQEKGW